MDNETALENSRKRSARRLRFEAQASVFEQRYGNLDHVRKTLGLRPSQICEILRVHPSAWIRWTRGPHKAPPHIYQMLEWYIELLRWRGQNHMFKDHPDLLEKTLSRQDPQAFVPPDPAGAEHNISTLIEKGAIKKRQMLTLWVITWILQIGIWAVIGLMIFKFRS